MFFHSVPISVQVESVFNLAPSSVFFCFYFLEGYRQYYYTFWLNNMTELLSQNSKHAFCS